MGVIGGSGLYELPGLGDVERRRVHTPFGDPSDEIVVGRLGETRLVFLPRHGRGHRLLPTRAAVPRQPLGAQVARVPSGWSR